MPYADPDVSREYHTRKSAEWAKNHPEKRERIRKKHCQTLKHKISKRKCVLKSKGWTPESYAAALVTQEYRCAVCLVLFDLRLKQGKGAACADHDHHTNKSRGILCSNCNLLLGHAIDSEEILLKAAAYLRKHKDASKKDR